MRPASYVLHFARAVRELVRLSSRPAGEVRDAVHAIAHPELPAAVAREVDRLVCLLIRVTTLNVHAPMFRLLRARVRLQRAWAGDRQG